MVSARCILRFGSRFDLEPSQHHVVHFVGMCEYSSDVAVLQYFPIDSDARCRCDAFPRGLCKRFHGLVFVHHTH